MNPIHQTKKQVKACENKKALMIASVASMIDQFNMSNIRLLQEVGYEVHVACNFKEGNTCDAQQIRRLHEKFCQMHVVWHQWDCPRKIGSTVKCVIACMQLWKLTGRYHFSWMHCHSPIGGAFKAGGTWAGHTGYLYGAWISFL